MALGLRKRARRLKLSLGAGVDNAFTRLAFRRPDGPRARQDFEALAGRLDALTKFYADAHDAGDLFPAPGELISPQSRHIGDLPEGEVLDLQWPSGFSPLGPDYRETMARCPENNTCHARWFRRPPPTPTMICLHGWGGGPFPVETRLCAASWFQQRGLDVVLMQLPFHARRASSEGRTPRWPSPFPQRANEGFAQAIWELRSLIAMLKARGTTHVGVMGWSLGGFTSALLATVEPELDFAFPMIPFGSLPALLWRHRDRDSTQSAGIHFEDYARAFEHITPLRRSLLIDADRVLIGAGQRDRVIPVEFARRLHHHFQGSHYREFPGSHLLQFGREAVFEDIALRLRHHQILAPT